MVGPYASAACKLGETDSVDQSRRATTTGQEGPAPADPTISDPGCAAAFRWRPRREVALVAMGTLLTGSAVPFARASSTSSVTGGKLFEAPDLRAEQHERVLRGFNGCHGHGDNSVISAQARRIPAQSSPRSVRALGARDPRNQAVAPLTYAGGLVSTTAFSPGARPTLFHPNPTADADSNTSEGIFVFTSSAPRPRQRWELGKRHGA